MRFSIKDLQKDYRKTEEDIKAVQSVGQIIGEVMKQLDDERCAYHPRFDATLHSLTSTASHSEGFVGTTLRRLLPTRTSRK